MVVRAVEEMAQQWRIPIVLQMKNGLSGTVKIMLNMEVAMDRTKNGSKNIAKLLATVANELLRHHLFFLS